MSEHDPLVGTELGGCRLETVLGRGGMGAVYRAHHLALDKPVAVKILAPFLSGDPDYTSRFLLEARAAARIEHPNVVQVLHVGQEEGRHFIIMTFVDGESVEDLLRRERRMGMQQATRIVREVAAGLGALHRAGVIHRDIKPANVLVSRDGSVRITDFGLARRVEKSTGLTADGSFMGTPEYVAPEQAEGTEVGLGSDLYSLGVTYFQMLTGQLPFEGRSGVDIAAKHMRDEPPAILELIPDLDPRAAAVTHRLLQKRPADRYPGAADLVAEFDRILNGSAVKAPPAPPPRPASAVAPTVPTPRPPPPPPSVPAPASTAVLERARRWVRAAVFWGLVLLACSLSFSVGALDLPRKGFDLEAFARTWTASDERVILRWALSLLAVIGFVAACVVNRAALLRSAGSRAGALLLAAAALGFYVGAAPDREMLESPVVDAVSRGLESRSDPLTLGAVGVWGGLTGLLFAAGRGWTRGFGFVLHLASLPLLAAWGAGGRVYALVSQAGVLLLGAAALAASALGLALASSSGRAGRLVGVLLALAGAAGAVAAGRLSGAGSTLPRMDEALQTHGLLLALLLGIWGVLLLRPRPPAVV